jgi:hypothetical protein
LTGRGGVEGGEEVAASRMGRPAASVRTSLSNDGRRSIMKVKTTQTEAKEEEQMEPGTITMKITIDADGMVTSATDANGDPLPYDPDYDGPRMEGNQLATCQMVKGKRVCCCWGGPLGRLKCLERYCKDS